MSQPDCATHHHLLLASFSAAHFSSSSPSHPMTPSSPMRNLDSTLTCHLLSLPYSVIQLQRTYWCVLSETRAEHDFGATRTTFVLTRPFSAIAVHPTVRAYVRAHHALLIRHLFVLCRAVSFSFLLSHAFILDGSYKGEADWEMA